MTELSVSIDRGTGPAVLFLHGEGVDGSIWDDVASALPCRSVAFDLRGHGASPVPAAPYAMGALVADVERAMDRVGLKDAVVVGLSLGAMVAQALAVKRLDLVRALVIVNGAAKIGTRAGWEAHAAQVAEGGMAAVADELARKWSARGADPTVIADRLLACDPEGYRGACAALAGTDLLAATATLRLPVLALAARDGRAVPPDLVRETAGLVPGAEFALTSGAGHLVPLDAPNALSERIAAFLNRIGHV